MFEKIGNAAEKMATGVSESRRGFLCRIGRVALGVAGVAGGLLALPPKAQAAPFGKCHQTGYGALDGICIMSDCSRWCWNTANCPMGTRLPLSFAALCGYRVAAARSCQCP